MAADERPLAGQAWLSAAPSRAVLRALAAGGKPVRFVGGCVRDGLLGRSRDDRDLDLATPEHPDDVLKLLAAAGLRAIPTGLAHGTVTAVVDDRRFEVTTLRRDVACDGRHAEVAFTDDFAADAARRDFTINAMSCDGEGRLYDDFGGRADLAAGRVRFVGQAAARIAEDYLRILRFFRFFAHFGRPPADAEALEACSAGAAAIERLSGERVQTEMLKLLEADDPVPALRLMAETDVLAQVMPGAVGLERLTKLIALVPAADAVLRLGALLRPPPANADAADGVGERWRLANRDCVRLQALVAADPIRLGGSTAEHRRALYRLGAERFTDLVRLSAADTTDDARPALAAAAKWQPRSLPVTGDDVLELGVPAGPRIGELLRALEDWWLAHDFQPDRAACLAQLRSLLAERET